MFHSIWYKRFAALSRYRNILPLIRPYSNWKIIHMYTDTKIYIHTCIRTYIFNLRVIKIFYCARTTIRKLRISIYFSKSRFPEDVHVTYTYLFLLRKISSVREKQFNNRFAQVVHTEWFNLVTWFSGMKVVAVSCSKMFISGYIRCPRS